jgi:hypothetical protein
MRNLAQFSRLALAVGFANACGGSDGGSPPTTPVVQTPVATQLSIRVHPSGTRIGFALSSQPIVEVLDAGGKLFTATAVSVTVAIGSGGGAITGTTTATTSGGVATFTNLVITGAAGARTLVFSATGLPSVTSQSFSLIGGTAAALKLVTSPSVQAQTMIALAEQPSLQLNDDIGAAITTPTVITASIVSGNAIISSGATATTNAAGLATFSGLTLGALRGTVGNVKLRFTPAGAANVSADADLTLGCSLQTLTLGQAISDRLGDGDCVFTNVAYFNKQYRGTLQTAGAIQVTQDGPTHAYVTVRGPNETLTWGYFATATRVSYKVLLPAGEFRTIASVADVGVSGPFTLTVASTTSDVGCAATLAMSPLTTTQALATSDCAYSDAAGVYYDTYTVGLPGGATVSATVTSAAFTPFVGAFKDTGYVAFQNGQGTTANLTYKNSTATGALYDIDVSSAAGETRHAGAYSVVLTISYPASIASAAPAATIAASFFSKPLVRVRSRARLP